MNRKTLVLILTGVFLLSLIPLYIIGFYAHPSVDDYYYGVQTSAVWKSTGSIGSVLSESFSQMRATYHDWQGNFSAIFLMRLQPGIFGEQAYVIAPLLLITTFCASMLLFFHTLFSKWIQAGRLASIAMSIAITFCALQFTHVPSDSFYWYNGSIYYTFFFSLMLFLFTFCIVMVKAKHRVVKAITFIPALPLAFLIGGGNYSTALFTSIILVLLTIWLVVKKRRMAIPIAAVMFVSLAGLVISMIAPGNTIRQAAVGGNSGVIKALMYSFAYGGYNIASSTTFPVVVMWITLFPLIYRAAKASAFRFRYPLLVLLFTFGVFCSQGTALFYAQGLRMPYRMMNIIYFTYYLFMVLNLFYLAGWMARRYPANPLERAMEHLVLSRRPLTLFIAAAVGLFAVGCIGLVSVSEAESSQAAFSGLPASASAALSLVNGQAATYDRELNERDAFLSTTAETNVVVAPLTAIPTVIFHTDITTDPTFWKNAHMALYYNKASVKLSD